MDKISVKDLMSLERILLEMTARMKYDLDFSDAYRLYASLRDVGRITSYAFLIQEEFQRDFNDKEKLEAYHEKVMKSSVEFDYKEVASFIDRVEKEYENEGFSKIVELFKFW